VSSCHEQYAPVLEAASSIAQLLRLVSHEQLEAGQHFESASSIATAGERHS